MTYRDKKYGRERLVLEATDEVGPGRKRVVRSTEMQDEQDFLANRKVLRVRARATTGKSETRPDAGACRKGGQDRQEAARADDGCSGCVALMRRATKWVEGWEMKKVEIVG